MALVTCSECGKEVSDRAEACPHCGNPLKGNAPAGKKRSGSEPSVNAGAGCLIIVAVFGVVIWAASQCASDSDKGTDSPKPVARPTSIDLAAAVRFTGTQFVISNNDAFNWSSCKLEINSGIVRGGYELRAPLLAARSTSTVGALQFAKGEGERFNPLSMRPNNFSIACDTPQGRGYYFAEWK